MVKMTRFVLSRVRPKVRIYFNSVRTFSDPKSNGKLQETNKEIDQKGKQEISKTDGRKIKIRKFSSEMHKKMSLKISSGQVAATPYIPRKYPPLVKNKDIKLIKLLK